MRNEREYRLALSRLAEDDQFLEAQRDVLVAQGLTDEQVQRVLEPTLSFHAQLREEIDWYERVKKGDFEVLTNLSGLGRLLIAVRIARGLSQKDVAERLGVSEAQVSRDERNEYHGITVDRAQRVLEALEATLVSEVGGSYVSRSARTSSSRA